MAYADLKVGDKVRLTGPGWDGWREEGHITEEVQVIESVEPGDEAAYGRGATYVTFEGFDKVAAMNYVSYAVPHFALSEENDDYSGWWKAEVVK